MTIRSNSWAIVLAGGEGNRLQSLTTDDSGDTVPKQFCSLRGGQSLLAETLQRAASVVEPDHICVIVAAQHRRWWEPMLSEMTKSNIIVQPMIEANRCGWSDLGTPKRLGETLRGLPQLGEAPKNSINSAFAPVNLSVQHARLRGTIQS